MRLFVTNCANKCLCLSVKPVRVRKYEIMYTYTGTFRLPSEQCKQTSALQTAKFKCKGAEQEDRHLYFYSQAIELS